MITYLGSLVQLCCGKEGTLQTNITGMCGECSQCLGHTGFAPTQGMCTFPVYTAQAPGCSTGELSKVGPGLHAFPRPKPLRFRLLGTPQRHRLGWSWFCVLPRFEQLRQPCAWRSHAPQVGSASYHHPSPSLLISWVCSGSAISGVPCVSSGELISPRCQPSKIPGRLG